MFTQLYVLITACCVLIVSALCRLAWRRFKFCQTLSRIPGPKGLPILGNVLQLKRDPHEYLNQLHDWCTIYNEGLYCIWYGPSPLIIIHSPEIAEVFLTSTKNINKSEFYALLHTWLGTGVLTSSDDKWKSRRKMLTSAFHFKILNNFTTVMQQHAKSLLGCLKKHCGKSKFDIAPYIELCTLDVICETAMGVDVKAQHADSVSEYVEAILGMSEMIVDRMKKPWLWNDMIYMLTATGIRFKTKLDTVRAFTNKIIDDRINERKEMKSSVNIPGKQGIYSSSQRKLLAMLDLLLEEYDAGNIDREGIREEVDTFTFTGQDTSSSALVWIIHLVGKHPDVQSKLQHEVDCFFDSTGEVITFDDLKQLEYTECVIKESLRLFPPAPLFGRTIDEECNLGPYVIPKGANYAILAGPLLRHPNHWTDPNLFKPERFHRRNYDTRRHPYSYIPFSAGPRNCIGQRFALMEIKIIISTIFHNFHVNATQETDKIRKTGDVVLRPLEGIWVELKERK